MQLERLYWNFQRHIFLKNNLLPDELVFDVIIDWEIWNRCQYLPLLPFLFVDSPSHWHLVEMSCEFQKPVHSLLELGFLLLIKSICWTYPGITMGCRSPNLVLWWSCQEANIYWRCYDDIAVCIAFDDLHFLPTCKRFMAKNGKMLRLEIATIHERGISEDTANE